MFLMLVCFSVNLIGLTPPFQMIDFFMFGCYASKYTLRLDT